MISLTANSRPEDNNGVVEIIKLLSDGAAYQKRFDEIKQMAEVAEKKIRDARQLEEKYANAESMMADAAALLAKHQEREAQLGAREEAVIARERGLADAEGAAKEHRQQAAEDMSKRENDVSVRERDAQAMEKSLAKATKKLDDDRADFDAKVTKHREHARAMLE